ncbi:LytR/AlgR family response regulator transcription factor [Chitinophaga barathri]|uniref:DNA-binding response regulator n=1 Tax=Chitinophaga barathri TaxID=1647451 RepID=A0A3N4M4X3_9BACT|nr:response regulator transcription factor [Chitinophaga barathri]RPD37935.1 DNA-binding response regulator [Chitinophaga barathri]
MKFKALIVEDETLSRDFLSNMVREYCPQLELVAVASNVEEALQRISAHSPQLIFLDIEMQTGTGFDVLQQAGHHDFHVIFTTAFDHYAIQAIKFSAVDYLLKPINLDELETAVNKAVKQMEGPMPDNRLDLLLKNLNKPAGEDFCISLSTSEGVDFIPLSGIIRLEAKGPYTIFYLKDGRQIMVSKNLKEYEMSLQEHGFFRIHNSNMINLKDVKRWVRTDGGYAVMSDGAMVAISPKKKDEFMALMTKRTV